MKESHLTLKIFFSFLKIGAFTFGGGYAMLSLIRNEVVDRRGWVPRERFLELLTLAQSAPGPISLNTAVFVGYNTGRWRGAVAAVLGTVIPSFAVILLIAMFFSEIRDDRVVAAVFKGMRPAVVALILAPAFGLARGMNFYRIGIAVLAVFAIWKLGISPVWAMVAGALGGIAWMLWRRNKDGMNKNPEP